MSENDDPDLALQTPVQTVAALRAVLAALPDDMPIMLDGCGLLSLAQSGEAGAGETRSRSGFVDDPDATPVAVLWLIGEARD